MSSCSSFAFRALRAVLLSGALLSGTHAARAQFVTDGTRETAYGGARAVQTNPTGFGNATTVTPRLADGSELDAAYAVVSAGALHLFLAGNLQSNGNKLEIFFDTKPGGQNVLLATNPAIDGNGLNAMAGLTFDTGFTADYYLTANVSAAGELSVSYATLSDANNTGALIGTTTATAALPLTFTNGVTGGEVALDNSNTGGVDGMSIGVPAGVTTGFEFVIPLAALGAPATDFSVTAFVNGSSHDFLSNQVLGGLPNGTANLDAPATVRFAAAANTGNQFFTVSNGGAPAGALITATPNPLALGSVTVGMSGTGAFTVSNVGTDTLHITGITSNNPAFAVSPTAMVLSPMLTTTLTVNFAPTTAGAQTATLTITSDANNSPSFTVTLTGTGVAPGAISVDGTLDPVYGAALAVQTTPTGFGDATAANAFGGSELDAAFARIANGNLYLLLTGNLEANGNDLEIFLDSQTGGQSVLSATNPGVDANGLNRMAGLTFDAGFAPDYYLTVQRSTTVLTANYAALTGAGGTGQLLTTGTAGITVPLDFGAAGSGILALDNSNAAGVTNLVLGTPAAVTTGLELQIPLAALGNPTGPIRVSAFVNGAAHDFVSNQVLAGLPAGTANLEDPTTVSFAAAANAGDQFFTIANSAPPAPVASLSATLLGFGTVAIGTTSTRTLRVYNTGTAALSVTGISSSIGTYSAAPATGTVAPGDSLTVTVTFAPTAGGPTAGTLTVATNDPAHATLMVALDGTSAPAGAINVDGTLDANYGTALALQTTPTGFGDATPANSFAGSELDGAYAHIANGTLYLLLTGNLQSNGNRLNLFFDTSSGTGQRLLGANNPDVDNNGLNRHVGLFFDGGFTADYFLTANLTTGVAGFTLGAGFAPVNGAGGTGLTLTSGAPGLSQTISFGASTGQLAIDNSNVAGVSGTAVGTPGAVTTGVEYAIPLSALGNPTGPIRVSAFVTSPDHGFMSNQTLAGLPNGTANLANPSNVNFGAYAGDQFFTIPNGTAAPVAVASASVLSFGATVVGTPVTRRLVVRNVGTAPLSVTGVTSTNPAFSAAPLTGTVAAGDSLALIVTFAPTTAGAASGSLLLTSNDPGQPLLSVGLLGTATTAAAPAIEVSPTLLNFGAVALGSPASTATFVIGNAGTAPLVVSSISTSNPAYTVAPATGTVPVGDSLVVTITFAPTTVGLQFATALILSNDPVDDSVQIVLNGTALPPSLIDGQLTTADGYGAALALQTTPTGFGDATNGQIDIALNGSELDGAYATISNGTLKLLLTGNLESNGNRLELFFDTQAGGQNVLLNTNPDVDGNGLNAMGGLTFDAGFAPDYYLTLNNTSNMQGYRVAAYFAPVNGAGGAGPTLANGPGRIQNLGFAAGQEGELAINNSNVAGVSGAALGSPGAVTTGVELAIPLAALGNPTGPIRISAFINGGSHDFLSNQVLGGLPAGTANIGSPVTASFAAAANTGNQFFVVPNGPTLALSTTTVNLGSVTIGQSGTNTFVIRNPGTAPLSLLSITAPVGPFTATPTTGTIAPGDSLVVTITFAPTTVGLQATTFTLTTNDPSQPTAAVQVTGTGVAAPQGVLTVSTTALSVGTVIVGSTGTATFTISNTGTAPIAVISLALPGGSVFSVSPATIGPLAAGDSVTVTVTFAPTTAGAQTASVTIQVNGVQAAVVTLSGTGLPVGLPAELAASVMLTPNPAPGRATLRVPGALLGRGATVRVLDALGRAVRTLVVPDAAGSEASVPLDLTSLPAGTYAVRLLTPDGTLTRRLVVLAE